MIGPRGVFTLFREYPDIHPIPKTKPGIQPPTEALLGILPRKGPGGFESSRSEVCIYDTAIDMLSLSLILPSCPPYLTLCLWSQ
jgi:hypothetical protein